MTLRLNSQVVAARNIKRDGEVLIPRGTPGAIVGLGGFVTLKYKVTFFPRHGSTVDVSRLTWRDVHGVN